MTLSKRLPRSISGLLAVVAITLIGVSLSHFSYADPSGCLSFTSGSSCAAATGSATVGSSTPLVVTMYENTAATTVGVDAVVNFSSNLTFVSATCQAPFTVATPATVNVIGHTVEIVCGYAGNTPPSGSQTVASITFQATSAGTGTLSFNNAASSIAPAANGPSLLTASGGGTYSLSNPSSGGGGGGTTTPPATSTPAPTPAPTPVTTNPKSTSISVVPKSGSSGGSSGGSAVTVPNNGSVAVTTPVSVEPTTIQSNGVSKVEYFLGSKLVDTETKPPYKYNINTAKLKNGSYNLVSKTFYTNGTTKEATQHLIVKNTAAHTENSLWLYFLVIGVIILIVLGVNFIGPSTGDPFKRLFKRYTLPPLSPSEDSDIHGGPLGPLPPVSGGPTAPTITMPSVSPPVHSDTPSSVAPGAPAASQPAHTSVHHLQPPTHPSPGTVFSPSSKDS